MKNNIKIREIEEKDIPEVAEIRVNAWKKAYKGIIEESFLKDLSVKEDIERRKQDYKNTGFIVAELDGEIVGFCRYIDNNSFSPNIEDIDCEIIALYVKIDLLNQGIGSKMFEYVKTEFNKKNKTKMILWCLKDNENAKKFYKKSGGQIIKEDKFKIGDKEYVEFAFCFNLI